MLADVVRSNASSELQDIDILLALDVQYSESLENVHNLMCVHREGAEYKVSSFPTSLERNGSPFAAVNNTVRTGKHEAMPGNVTIVMEKQYVYRRRSRQAWVLLDFCDRDSSYRELLLVKASSMRALCSDTEKCSEKRINHDNCLIRLHTTTPLTYTFAFCNPSVETCPIIVNIQSASAHPSWGFQIL